MPYGKAPFTVYVVANYADAPPACTAHATGPLRPCWHVENRLGFKLTQDLLNSRNNELFRLKSVSL